MGYFTQFALILMCERLEEGLWEDFTEVYEELLTESLKNHSKLDIYDSFSVKFCVRMTEEKKNVTN